MKIGGNTGFQPSSTLQKSQETREKLFEQIATGLRINQGADDAAGLQISNQLTSQINGQNQAIRNANDGISLAQVAEGALSGVTDAAFRIEELSIQAANGTLGPDQRQAIQAEITQLQGQISDTFSQTRFGDQQVFGGSFELQVGANANETIGLNVGSSSLADIDVTTQAGAQAAISTVQSFREGIDSNRAQLGAFQNRAESTINNLQNINENSEASRSRIRDTDIAGAVSRETAAGIQSQAAIALQAQANFSNRQALNLLS